MRLVDITVWMVRREQVAQVVWGAFHPVFGREVLVGNQVNATMQTPVGMGELVQAGMFKGVPGQEQNMENEAGHVLKVGLEVWLAT